LRYLYQWKACGATNIQIIGIFTDREVIEEEQPERRRP